MTEPDLAERHAVVPGGGRRFRHVILIAAIGAGMITSQVVVWPENRELAVVRVLVGLGFAVTAVLLDDEMDQRPNARLFALAAVLWMVGRLDSHVAGPLPFAACLAGRQVDTVLAAILLRFPGTSWGRMERRYVIVAATWTVGAQLLWMLSWRPEDFEYRGSVWWPVMWPDSTVSQYVDDVATAGFLVLLLVFLSLLGRRWRRAQGMDRDELVPVCIAGAATAAVVLVQQIALLLPATWWLVEELAVVANVLRLLIPVAFLASAVTRRLARAGVADLVVRLSASGDVESLREGLRTALRDPTIEVAYWLPERAEYVSDTGHPIAIDTADPDRLVVPVETSSGEPLAVVLAARSVERHRGPLQAATAASRLALENARLQASLRSRMKEVEASRARIVEAELAGRRRLERDIHDGAQQRLLVAAMRLGTVCAAAREPAVVDALESARSELAKALQDLRDLSSGVLPAVLAEGGLRPALETVADRLPVPVDLDVPGARYRPEIEAAVYFVACEALTNVAKYAGACVARVCIRETNGSLEIHVSDTGRGGASIQARRGLAGLQDRTVALGGRLSVDSAPGVGTSVRASVPCG